MKKSFFFLPLMIFLFFTACKKESIPPKNDIASKDNLGPIVKRMDGVNPGSTEVPLVYNPADGSYTAVIFGAEIKFSNIIYDILYDANGLPLVPKEGDPVYATVSFNPNDYSNQWSLIAAPDAPSNQFIFQVPSIYLAPFFPDLGSYWAAVDTYRNNYANQLNAAWQLIFQVQWNLPPDVNVSARVDYNPPHILNYITTLDVGGSGNRIIVGSLIKKADGSLAARISDVPLS